MTGPAPFRVGYLVNRYPAVSHAFIRREIAGVEAKGIEVVRFSIRDVPSSEIVDPADRAERERTSVLLDGGILPLLGSLLAHAILRPIRFLRALGKAWTLGGRSGRRLVHLAYLAEACRLRRRLARASAGHLHAHFGTNPAAVALLCRILGGPPYSFTVHGPEEFDRPEALGLDEKIARAEFVVAVSDFGRSQLMRWTPAARWPRLHVVRCGVDAEFLAADGVPPPPDRPRLVCVGRLCGDKAQLLLVEAAGRLAREGREFELVLVGDGDIRGILEEKIRALGLAKIVLLRGWLDGAGVRREITEARALVLPSFAEGLPVVIMEALAMGRPVLSTYVAGIPELVRPGVNGWLVTAGSVDELTDRLRETLDAPAAKLAELGRAGRATVAERHDSRREAARLAEQFRLASAAGGS
jgi:glycosyltransferase involved in cell wall biosynthesis